METEVCKYKKPSQKIHFIPDGGERISEHLLHVQNVVIPKVMEASKSLRTETTSKMEMTPKKFIWTWTLKRLSRRGRWPIGEMLKNCKRRFWSLKRKLMIFIWINPFKGLGELVCYFKLRKMKEKFWSFNNLGQHLLDPWLVSWWQIKSRLFQISMINILV